MAAKKKPYVKMICSVCKSINYNTHKSKKAEGKLELKKFCKKCRKRVPHKESKK